MQERLKDLVTKRGDAAAGIIQLTKLVGLQSLKAAGDFEEQAGRQELEAVRQDMNDPEVKHEEANDKKKKMRDILATGDVYLGNEPKQASTPSNGVAGKIAASGLAALGLGAALSLPIIAWNMTKPDPEQEVNQVDLGARFVPVPQPRTQ